MISIWIGLDRFSHTDEAILNWGSNFERLKTPVSTAFSRWQLKKLLGLQTAMDVTCTDISKCSQPHVTLFIQLLENTKTENQMGEITEHGGSFRINMGMLSLR